ncbi:TetR/AcrR family transcriptional regulator [Nitrogeniibacter mangrovi]|uniref:TetR/AcrR family transcriptional regulator n=1 Tax=Nitrogeniibacter mangrovi TaxID=2016596 RepID=A0A6C1B102_9RHOO|nr:TetR/AcrR family transcriptional regulator [Nitrogeniibacter mangrovi]QID16585.1 TetR/AcrR family transcriptional regulator [Nitrogeniibacter mangrovi]
MLNRKKPSRWQRRADARPQELLDAALAEFVERGYAATRLDAVARRAGVAKGTLYRYYENKFELFKAVVRHALVPGFDEVAQRQHEQPSGARARLVLMLTTFMERVAGSALSGIPKLVIAEAGNFPEVARFYYEEVISRARDMVAGTLREGVATGEFRAIDADYAWRIVVAPLLMSILWRHSFAAFEAEPLDLRHHLEVHLDLLFDGLAADGTDTERT